MAPAKTTGCLILTAVAALANNYEDEFLQSRLAAAADYYADIDASATNEELKSQLCDLIYPHTVYSYGYIWSAFEVVDTNLPTYPCDNNNSHIPDIYSSYCWAESQECGNYKKEGDCYNREHIWPKSWFGGFEEGCEAETDLFELWPSDGYVNGMRGDLPLGNVKADSVTYTSTNGCRIGTCNTTGYTGKCFEPTDLYKGDIARSYFYLSTAYYKHWTCCDTAGVNGADIKTWMEDILREWHKNDPVDQVERNRNEEIYVDYQHNRNPFIDHPEWVDQIDDF